MNLYPPGQCTWWCVENFPSLPNTLGDAHSWIDNAARAGYAVGGWPVATCVVCFAPGQQGAGIFGHVAVVVDVASTGRFSVAEMDFPRPGVVTTRANLDPREVAGFIYPPVDPHHVVAYPQEAPMTRSTKLALIRLAYLASMGREPETPEAEAAWAERILDDASNVDLVVSEVTDSPEAQAYRSGRPQH